MGKIVAASLAAHYLGELMDVEAQIEQELPEGTGWTVEGLLKLVLKGVNAGIKTGIPFGGKLLSVEQDIGGARPDVVWRTPEGKIELADHKVALSLDTRWLPQRLQEANTKWQFFDYAWRVGNVYGESVETVYLHQIILHPRCYAILHPVSISAERLRRWADSAWQIDEQIRYEQDHPEARWMNWTSCTTNPYTKDHLCEFYDGCHILHGDESRFATLYDAKQLRGE